MSTDAITIDIDAAFDGGNIHVVSIEGNHVDLEIRPDRRSSFYQWFHFSAKATEERRITFRILNAAGASYPLGWHGYNVRTSSDCSDWRLVETEYDDGILTWDWTVDSPLAWFAYFAPFSMERHAELVARTALCPGVGHRILGQSLDGQPIDYFRLGSGPVQLWLYARQHPGETMAEWWMEGALSWLTGPHSSALLARATVHVVPNMNPDGTRRGHLRTNAEGVDLNRAWDAPTAQHSPEVLCVREAMQESGVDFAMDIHGDETIPACFLEGCEGVPSWVGALGMTFELFRERLSERTADFQTALGYPTVAAGTADLSTSTNYIAAHHGALAMTLEMPFKDHDANPDPEHGWSPDRARRLAVACLETLTGMIDEIGCSD